MDPGWKFNETDRLVLEELRDFLPERVFDAHTHLWSSAAMGEAGGSVFHGPPEVTLDVWRQCMAEFFPGADLVGGIFIAYCPRTGDDPLR